MKSKRLEQTLLSWFKVQERNHLLLMVALSFLTGCLCASSFDAGIWLWALVVSALLLGFLLKMLGRRAGIAVSLLFFAFGILRAQAAMRISQPLPGTYNITATVSGGTRLCSDNRVTFVLADVLLDGVSVSGRG